MLKPPGGGDSALSTRRAVWFGGSSRTEPNKARSELRALSACGTDIPGPTPQGCFRVANTGRVDRRGS